MPSFPPCRLYIYPRSVKPAVCPDVPGLYPLLIRAAPPRISAGAVASSLLGRALVEEYPIPP